MRHLLAILSAVTFLCLALQPVAAQVNLQRLSMKGKILGIQPNGVTIQTEAGPMLGSLDPARRDGNVVWQNAPNPKFNITGTTSLDALDKGLLVRFTVELENRKAVGEIKELTILGLEGSPDNPPGLLPEGAVPPVPGEEGPKGAKPQPAVNGKFIAVGTIASYKAGNLNLSYAAGRGGSLPVKVSPEAQVKVESRDPRLMRIGDIATMEGASHRQGFMFVTEINIIRDANIEKNSKPMRPVAAKPETKRPMKGEKMEPGVAEKPSDAPATPEGPARPKTKGKVVTIN